MTTNKTDRRVLRTRQSLIDALISLSLEHGYEVVTIKDITQCANVSYSTFFRHFKSKDDLTTRVFRTARQKLTELYQEDSTPYEEALEIYKYMSRNRGVFLLCASVPRNHPALSEARDEIAAIVKTEIVALDESIVPIDAIGHHFSSALLELFRWWLENGLKYSPAQMARIHCELIVKARQSVARDVDADDEIDQSDS